MSDVADSGDKAGNNVPLTSFELARLVGMMEAGEVFRHKPLVQSPIMVKGAAAQEMEAWGFTLIPARDGRDATLAMVDYQQWIAKLGGNEQLIQQNFEPIMNARKGVGGRTSWGYDV